MKLQITEYWKHENHHKNDGLKDHKLLHRFSKMSLMEWNNADLCVTVDFLFNTWLKKNNNQQPNPVF